MSLNNQLKIRKHQFMEIGKKGIMIHITEKLKTSTTKKELKMYIEHFFFFRLKRIEQTN